MKEITSIDPISTAKISALLGVLWAVLGWLFSSIVISLLVQGAPGELADVPRSFSPGGLASGIIGGFIGGGITGYLGSVVYNLLSRKIGGVRLGISD